MKPYLRSLWTRIGDMIDPERDDRNTLLEKFPDLTYWQARDVLAAVRKMGRPSDAAGASEPAPSAGMADAGEAAPVERGTAVKPDGEGIVVTHSDDEVNARVMNLDDLIAVAKIDLTQWEPTGFTPSTWTTVTKDANDNPVVTRNWGVRATFKPRVVPLVSLDWPPPPVYVTPYNAAECPPVRRALVLPDSQIGFAWRGLANGNPWAEPFHDRAAIDVALQILARTQPDDVILIGDMLDFQPLSTRWGFGDEARQTTQMAIREWAWLLYRMRQIAPRARFTYMLGNHERRLIAYITERAGELAALAHHDGRPALCLRQFLGLDALQIDTHDYPQPFWLWDRIEIEHGRVVRGGGGATAAAIIAKREHSVCYGHVHRAEVAQRKVEQPGGYRLVTAASPGCLCRTDGIVPGSDRPDWQQGVGLWTLIDGADEEYTNVRIDRGRAVFGGEVIVGRDYVGELVEATGAVALLSPQQRKAA